MASGKIIRYLGNDVGNTLPSETSCAYAPVISLIYDTDGPRGKFGNIVSVQPNPSMEYEFVIMKQNYYVDVTVGGELKLDDFQLVSGDRVWLNGQLNPLTNGIYEVTTAAWNFVRSVTPNVFVDLGVRSSDFNDGDITRTVVIDHSSIDFAVTGFYSIVYQVVNSAGIMSQKTRKIKVIPEAASISPVPGIKITQYDITAESTQKLALAQFGVSADANIPQSAIDMGRGVIASPNSTLFIRKDGSIVFIANQSMGGNRLTDVGDPVDQDDAINLKTLEQAILSLSQSFNGLTPSTIDIAPETTVYADTVDASSHRTMKWLVEIENVDLSTYYSTEILFVNTASGGEYTLYGSIGDGEISDFDIHIEHIGANIVFQIENLTTNQLRITYIRLRCS